MTKKLLKNQGSKKVSMSPKSQPSKRQKRKTGNPSRVPPTTEPCSGSTSSHTWICKNSACRAVLSIFDNFCKRCSCFICHFFDENKDPSLWLECASDSPAGSCGASCHIECAFQRRKVGVVDLGQLVQLDGSYCCASCGKVSGILGYWKKQLTIAKDSRRIDNLCYRIHLSFRLFDGTSRFQDLHEIVKEAKTKLETEVGPLGGVSAMMARGIVSRLPVAGEVQELCNAAIRKADEVSATLSSARLHGKEVSILAACKNPANVRVPHNEGTSGSKDAEPHSVSKVRDLGKVLQLPWVEEQGHFHDIPGADASRLGQVVNPDTTKADGLPSTSLVLDLNVATVPDLNEDAAPQNDSPRGEADQGSGGSENWAQHGPNVEAPAVDSRAEGSRKRPASTEAHDCNLDASFEHCVEMIRSLECKGHIKPEFRLKLLTWFSLWSTEKERRVVNTFIRTLANDPSSLAEQLVDSFADVINNKRS